MSARLARHNAARVAFDGVRKVMLCDVLLQRLHHLDTTRREGFTGHIARKRRREGCVVDRAERRSIRDPVALLKSVRTTCTAVDERIERERESINIDPQPPGTGWKRRDNVWNPVVGEVARDAQGRLVDRTLTQLEEVNGPVRAGGAIRPGSHVLSNGRKASVVRLTP